VRLVVVVGSAAVPGLALSIDFRAVGWRCVELSTSVGRGTSGGIEMVRGLASAGTSARKKMYDSMLSVSLIRCVLLPESCQPLVSMSSIINGSTTVS